MMRRPFRPSLPTRSRGGSDESDKSDMSDSSDPAPREPGGFGACSRWLRSAATTPPDRGPQPQPHPGGMPAGARQHRPARPPKRLGLNMFSRRGAGARRRNHLNPTTPPITAARDSGWGCACHPLLRASAPLREKSKRNVIPDTNYPEEPDIVQADDLRFDSFAISASSARESSPPSGWAQPQPPRPGRRGGATGRWRSGFGAGLERFGLARPRPAD